MSFRGFAFDIHQFTQITFTTESTNFTNVVFSTHNSDVHIDSLLQSDELLLIKTEITNYNHFIF